MTPKIRSWQLSEAPFIPAKLSHTETIYTIGNRYMGIRATFEEGYPGDLPSTLVHGVYNHPTGDLVPELVNMPNPLPIMIRVDGEVFHMDSGKVLGFRRTLDMQHGLYERAVLWRNTAGTIVQITFARFASLELEHLLCQRVTVRALNGTCKVELSASLDATPNKHWASLANVAIPGARIGVAGETSQSHYRVALVSSLAASQLNGAVTVRADTDNPQQPSLKTEVTLAPDEAATFDKFTAIYTSRDTQPNTDATAVLNAAAQTLDSAALRSWESLKSGHVTQWANNWADCDVEIDGDEIAQRAIRFAIYHILIAAPRHDDRVSIGAKTLSGPGYKGHVFWDTELFMLPVLTFTQPQLARNLLMYRYHNLPGARKKAHEAGFAGAMFPWESTDTGEETTPRWTDPMPDGTRIRIWTGDTEQHISTDIAYAVMQYFRWSGDRDFFRYFGAEIVLDTAVFWGNRVEFVESAGRYELTMQIGPDEYHENINNSTFTNRMVCWHLQAAIDTLEWLKTEAPDQAAKLLGQLNIKADTIAHWRDVIARMYFPYNSDLHIPAQFDGFFNLTPIELGYWQPRVNNMDWILGHEATQHTMVIKQADIVMLMALLGDAFGSPDEQRRSWDFYSKVVDHGSSLSPSIHAWVAARLGLIDEAYDLWMYAAGIDLDDAKGNVRDGIHGAACGGLWQAIVFGFAGLKMAGNTYSLDPHLPPHWKSLCFHFYFNGERQTVQLTSEVSR